MRLGTTACTAALLSCALFLSACSSPTSLEQSNAVVEDAFGCPTLSGTYAVQAPDPEAGVKLDGSVFDTIRAADADPFPLSMMSGVVIGNDESGGVSFRFLIADDPVMAQLEMFREYKAQQYQDWYRLQQQPARAEYVTRYGEEAFQKRVAELGPRTQATLRLQRGKDFTCDDGWMEIPRSSGNPIRLTMSEDGGLVAQSQELSTYDVAVWCGDGCKYFGIPTGTYVGTMQWPKAPSLRAWTADGMANRFVFLRPQQDVEAEQALFAANTASSNARRYAPFEQIRERFAAIAPQDIQVLEIEFVDDAVLVRMGFPDTALSQTDQNARIDWMIAAVEEGHPRMLDPKDVVKRGISNVGDFRNEVGFTLRDGPLVLRDEAAQVTQAPAVAAGATQETMVLQPLLLMPPTNTGPAVAATAEPGPAEGIAASSVMQERLSAYLAADVAISQVRSTGDHVFLTGTAPTMRAVSDSMRSLDTAAAPTSNAVELVSIQQQGSDGFRFELILRRSALIAQ